MTKNSGSILDLYTRIPDYSEVKHLGNSDFINTLERLKEDFRRCRASLHDVDSEVEYISSKTSKILNISHNHYNTSSSEDRVGQQGQGQGQQNQSQKYLFPSASQQQQQQQQRKKSVNIISPLTGATQDQNQRLFSSGSGFSTNPHFYLPPKNTNNVNSSNHFGVSKAEDSNDNKESGQREYLSVTSCELHRNPKDNLAASCNLRPSQFQSLNQNQFQYEHHHQSVFESVYREDYDLCSAGDESLGSGDSGLSKWSSSPEIYTRDKEFIPPSNVEQRLLMRRSQNNSAPSIPSLETKPPQYFKANPVPSHVHKPLFDLIMLKNKRRSMRVREKSKQKLLAQVKPFSFSSNPKSSKCSHNHNHSSHTYEIPEKPEELLLNNSRPVKNRKNQRQYNGGVKTNNNRFGYNHHFKANPAPPRTRALLSAIKLKEQQEYRELKKRLRAEALMKTASLPPSMAARDRRTKATLNRLDQILNRYNSMDNNLDGGCRRHFREGTVSSDTFTDEDRLTDAEETYLLCSSGRTGGLNSNPNFKISRPCTSNNKGTRSSKRRSGNFTPYGELRFPTCGMGAAGSVFEATSNDNHASRLRVQVAREKELSRIKHEEEELMRSMKSDKKRQLLRHSHAQAWRIAGSYSSAQDIAMRRQLRQAAAILERESYKRDMSTMLTRVRSAPLLLEGLRERKFEPCKKHRDEMSGGKPSGGRRGLGETPRKWGRGNEELEKSETAAMAEGSLTNSDNESTKHPELDYDEEERQRSDRGNENDKSGSGNNSKSKGSHHDQKTGDHSDQDGDEDTYSINDEDGDFEEDVNNDVYA